MNAAFLLVTGAMLVGQGGDKKVTPAPTPAPAVSSSCCNTDPCGCEGWGHRLRGKLGGLFHRSKCDSCQPTTCHTNQSSCNDCCKPKFWNHQPREKCNTGCGHNQHNHCAPANTCTDSCCGSSSGLLSRLRHNFHNNGCCDGGCGTVGTAPKAGEKIDAPKKMPEPPKKVNGEVRFQNSVPVAPTPITVTPSVPTVEVTPIPVPRVEGDRRDPF